MIGTQPAINLYMIDHPKSEQTAVLPDPHLTRRAEPQELHSFQDLPESVGQVSSGPLGSVARKDHVSWKTKPVTNPAHWIGRLDSELGERIDLRPIPSLAICFGVGLILGIMTSFTESSRSGW